jgi:hypothetical protein
MGSDQLLARADMGQRGLEIGTQPIGKAIVGQQQDQRVRIEGGQTDVLALRAHRQLCGMPEG